jgi:hypothetical protein
MMGKILDITQGISRKTRNKRQENMRHSLHWTCIPAAFQGQEERLLLTICRNAVDVVRKSTWAIELNQQYSHLQNNWLIEFL